MANSASPSQSGAEILNNCGTKSKEPPLKMNAFPVGTLGFKGLLHWGRCIPEANLIETQPRGDQNDVGLGSVPINQEAIGTENLTASSGRQSNVFVNERTV